MKKKRKKKSRPVILAPADLQRNFDNFRADWDDRPTTLCGEPHTR